MESAISNKMLKLVAKEVSVPLSILFNRSFRKGKLRTFGNIQMLYHYRRKAIVLILQTFDQYLFCGEQGDGKNELYSNISILFF